MKHTLIALVAALSSLSACQHVAAESPMDGALAAQDGSVTDSESSTEDAASDEPRGIDPFSPADPSKRPWELEGLTRFEANPNPRPSTSVTCDPPCRRTVEGLIGDGGNQICRRGDWLWYYGGTGIGRANVSTGQLERFDAVRPEGVDFFVIGGVACTTEALVIGLTGSTGFYGEGYTSIAVVNEQTMQAKTIWTRTRANALSGPGIISMGSRGRAIAIHDLYNLNIAIMPHVRAEPVTLGFAPEESAPVFMPDERSIVYGANLARWGVLSLDPSLAIRGRRASWEFGGYPTGDERYVVYARVPEASDARGRDSEMMLHDRRTHEERLLSTSAPEILKVSPYVAGDWVVWVEHDGPAPSNPTIRPRSIWAHRISTAQTQRLLSGLWVRNPFIMDGKVYFQLETLNSWPNPGWDNYGLYETSLPE